MPRVTEAAIHRLSMAKEASLLKWNSYSQTCVPWYILPTEGNGFPCPQSLARISGVRVGHPLSQTHRPPGEPPGIN